MTEEAVRMAVGQVWWDALGCGFAEVRLVENGLATVSGPTEFWKDSRTVKRVRRVAVECVEKSGEWSGPYDTPESCPHAEFSTTLGAWVRKGLIL